MRRLKLAIAVVVGGLIGSAQAQYQAQDGWSLPRVVLEADSSWGVVADAVQRRVFVATTAGIEVGDLRTGARQTLFSRQGVRGLIGASRPAAGTVIVWRERGTSAPDSIWAWWDRPGGATTAPRSVVETSNDAYAVALDADGPRIYYTETRGTTTVLMARSWNGPAREIYSTPVNIGALGAAITDDGRSHLVFAQGYKNANESVYNAVMLSEQTGAWKRTALGPAVYQGSGQRFMVATLGARPEPVWLWETPEAQRAATLTGRHQPRLARWRDGRALAFDGPGAVIGQLGARIYWRKDTRIHALDITSADPVTLSTPLMSPMAISGASLSGRDGFALVAWQSLRGEEDNTLVYSADTEQPYTPVLLDRVAVALGWNPYYPAQSALVQTLLSLLFAALATATFTPLLWITLGSSKRSSRRSPVLPLLTACGLIVALRVVGELVARQPEVQDWAFAPLLTPPWALMPVALAAGVLLALGLSRRLHDAELAPVMIAATVTFTALFVQTFARAGFVAF